VRFFGVGVGVGVGVDFAFRRAINAAVSQQGMISHRRGGPENQIRKNVTPNIKRKNQKRKTSGLKT
jgi:hypothetical protein